MKSSVIVIEDPVRTGKRGEKAGTLTEFVIWGKDVKEKGGGKRGTQKTPKG